MYIAVSGTALAYSAFMILSIGLCIATLSSVGFISSHLNKAPEGWEDENGFHCLPATPADARARSGYQPMRRAAVLRTGGATSLAPLAFAKRLVPQIR